MIRGPEFLVPLFRWLCKNGHHGTRRSNWGYSRGCQGCANLTWRRNA